MRYLLACTLALLVVSCSSLVMAPSGAAVSTTVEVVNSSGADATVYLSFGADSVVLPADWPFCKATAKLNCSFPLKAGAAQPLPLSGKRFNATMAFDAPVSCGSTKAEVNVNNPAWFDVVDVSLVDGYSNKVWIEATDGGKAAKLGPPNGVEGNEKVFGVYPLGCDICTARQNPPCDQKPGKDGCKAGSQYDPEVPCQWQGVSKGGGSSLKVVFTGA